MKRVPRALAGKPRLCEAWIWKKKNPKATPYEMGKAVSYRATDGWRIQKKFKELDIDPDDILIVHPNLKLTEKSAIILYNLVLEFEFKFGLPIMTTSADLSEKTGFSKNAICANMRKLKTRGIVNYYGSQVGMLLEEVDYPLHAV